MLAPPRRWTRTPISGPIRRTAPARRSTWCSELACHRRVTPGRLDHITAGQTMCDGESACRRGSVHGSVARVPIGDHPSVRPTWRLPPGRDGRAALASCSALLRVGFAEPPGSLRVLVRSYRTVSPLPVPVSRPSAVCSLWHFPAGRPDWPLASTLPSGAPTFLNSVSENRSRAAITRPAHRRRQSCRQVPKTETRTADRRFGIRRRRQN